MSTRPTRYVKVVKNAFSNYLYFKLGQTLPVSLKLVSDEQYKAHYKIQM